VRWPASSSARHGQRVTFATAHQWVQRPDRAQRAGRLDAERDKLRRIPLLICDDVGYVRFEPDSAALFYALIASRYERASLVVSMNKPFSSWTEIFGDAVAVAAMVDRLVHHVVDHQPEGDS
jgi:DNA replication protein DnaC